MPEAHADRRTRLLERLTGVGDAALITSLVNVRYLTGFSGSNGALLLSPDHCVLATDGRYQTQAAAQSPDVDLLLDRDVATALAFRAMCDGTRRLAFEEHVVTVQLHDRLTKRHEGIELVRLAQMVEHLRAIKDAEEIALITTACDMADAAFTDLLAVVHAGQTEREVAWTLEERMRLHGADGLSFDTIVAAGPNSAVPHHEPSDRELQVGDLVKCDFGALYQGYHSDMTRTFVLGAPSDWQREIHALVADAQQAGRDAATPGADCRRVDDIARAVIEASSYAGAFVHGLGHGVGLEIHEAPSIGPTATGSLAEDMVVTVEPGVYLPGRGGVRIEDTLVVGAAGPQVLTQSPRELISV